jgi:hypothetical protein
MVDDDTVDIMYPTSEAGQKLHVSINHHQMSVATNEQRPRLWLSYGQQPLCKKGNGCSVHVPDFILFWKQQVGFLLPLLNLSSSNSCHWQNIYQ